MYISSGSFCGVNLYDYYNSDEYVNGIEGGAFKLLRLNFVLVKQHCLIKCYWERNLEI